jgi:hypothetical protein
VNKVSEAADLFQFANFSRQLSGVLYHKPLPRRQINGIQHSCARQVLENKAGQDGILRADWQSSHVLARCLFLPPETFPPSIFLLFLAPSSRFNPTAF